jgi:hypothetical protein
MFTTPDKGELEFDVILRILGINRKGFLFTIFHL